MRSPAATSRRRAVGPAARAAWFRARRQRLPLRRPILTYNNKPEFPALLEDRWTFYLEQNGLTPISALAHRVKLLTDLDLRPILAAIPPRSS